MPNKQRLLRDAAYDEELARKLVAQPYDIPKKVKAAVLFHVGLARMGRQLAA